MAITFTYPATVAKVVDGDTLDVLLDLGFGINYKIRVRLAGINAPEKSTPEGTAASVYLYDQLPAGLPVVVTTHKSKDMYGRYIADITKTVLDEQININKLMVSSGNAIEHKY